VTVCGMSGDCAALCARLRHASECHFAGRPRGSRSTGCPQPHAQSCGLVLDGGVALDGLAAFSEVVLLDGLDGQAALGGLPAPGIPVSTVTLVALDGLTPLVALSESESLVALAGDPARDRGPRRSARGVPVAPCGDRFGFGCRRSREAPARFVARAPGHPCGLPPLARRGSLAANIQIARASNTCSDPCPELTRRVSCAACKTTRGNISSFSTKPSKRPTVRSKTCTHMCSRTKAGPRRVSTRSSLLRRRR